MVLEGDSIFGDPVELSDAEIISGLVKTRTFAYYVGGDFTEGSVQNSASETEVLDFNIPANTVVNGIKITMSGRIKLISTDAWETIFRVKVGTNGAEVERSRIVLTGLDADGAGAILVERGNSITVVDNLDWRSAQTVSITVEMDAAGTFDKAIGEFVLIEGF